MTTIATTQLGRTGPTTSAIGLGCMAMSGVYGPADREQSIATINAALDQGITLIDTGDFYGFGHNELLISEALRGRPRESYQLSVKFGALRGPDNSWGGTDTRPEAMRNFLGYSLQRLGTDHVDVYRPARLDENVPIEDTIGAIAEMVEAGFVRNIGLSEVGSDTIRRAAAVHPISDLQIEYSLLSRGIEDGILATCRELGIAVTAYGVLSRGLLSATAGRDQYSGAGDFRSASPRFQGENLTHNLELVDRLRRLAPEVGLTVGQLAIAWVAAQGSDIIPLIGTRKPERLTEAAEAVAHGLTPEQLAEINQAVPAGAAAGDRYASAQMAHLDSEKQGRDSDK